MTKPIQSFFDQPHNGYRLWNPPKGLMTIAQKDIIFQAPLYKQDDSQQLKERYLVLTDQHLFYLKSEREPEILAIMKTDWVRCDYLIKKVKGGYIYTIRFIRNMRYTDLVTYDEEHFKEWKKHLVLVFLQCDFHQKFNTIKMIGKGSFARVYLVEDKFTGRRYAVKAFSKEYLLSQPKGKDSLLNEILVMKKLNHENIMKLEEIHESKNSIYLVLELLQGGELLNYMTYKKRLGHDEIHNVMKCLLHALNYMADKNIMHRDLKPDNIILKKKSNLSQAVLKLVDFGLATPCDVDEYLFKRCGTPGFVAPEIILAPSKQNIHYSSKCDVFSAGIIFYILLTNRSPFEGKTFKEILQKNKECKINFNLTPLMNNKLAFDLLKKMLEKDVDRRISAKEACSHPYLVGESKQMQVEETEQKSDESYMKGYQKQIEIMKKNVNWNNSLVIRDHLINGNIDTLQEDFNQRGFINSFKSMCSPKIQNKKKFNKRESILKYVLIQNAKKNLADIYSQENFFEEKFSSQQEMDYLF